MKKALSLVLALVMSLALLTACGGGSNPGSGSNNKPGATADPDWMNITMPQTKDPFADCGAGAGPHAVYKILYDAVSMGLTEDSPTATDWEGCKPMMNDGRIGTLVLGSWAIIQMQEPNMDNAADIGYMPFPISVNGTQYASAGADYCYGVNKASSDDNKIASMSRRMPK